MKWTFGIVLMLLLAGCSGKDDGREGNVPSSSQTATGQPNVSSSQSESTSPIPLPPSGNTSMPTNINLSGCHGWDAYKDTPSGGPSTNVPPGWESSDPTDLPGVGVLVLSCELVGVGPIERGPVTMMFDRHWNADFPAKCTEDAPTSTEYSVMAGLYVDDADVAAYLTQTFGLPTRLLEITEASQGTGGVITHELSWSVDGGEASSLTVLEDETVQTRHIIYRFYWPVGDRLGRLQLDPDMDGPQFANRVGHGTFKEPMMMASLGEEFVGVADWFKAINSETTVLFYDNFGCEQPG